ncbi:MAG: diiron oxygenase [Myxococcota bacterium]
MIVVHLGPLALDHGGTVLVDRALRGAAPGAEVRIDGTHPELIEQLRTWCRVRGHQLATERPAVVVRGATDRWRGALATGHPDPTTDGAIAAQADPRWGLAARGATVEDGPAELAFALSDRDEVWLDDAPRLYAQAVAAQWDPATAVPWHAPIDHPDAVEDAVVQLMTYLIENETAALLVPARFIGQVHPQFREVQALLAIQAADEARHVEVFTRRATLRRGAIGTSSRGGQASLATLVAEPSFALATFLLSVLGETSFLELLRFLHDVGPDPVTRAVARLAAVDEARHVAFAVGHLRHRIALDPNLRGELAAGIHARNSALRHTTGLNDDVFDALVIVAAGGLEPDRIEVGFDRVTELVDRMDRARRAHLVRLGYDDHEAAALSALHTRNFM